MKETQHKAFQFLIISFITFFSFYIPGNAQKVINEYAKVLEVFNADTTDVDSVKINTPIFQIGDTALFIVMKGTEVYMSSGLEGTLSNYHNIGIYNILLVFDVSDSIVIFTTRLRKLIAPGPGQITQLIKVRGGKDIYTINEPLTCKPWDPSDGTGGVFILVAGRKIVLNSNIDVSGKGFLGGNPNVPAVDYFTGNCSEAIDLFYTESAYNSSGRRGESVVYEGFPYTRGRSFVAHGGGGGNGKYSGGGGGGNWGQGGNGGMESENCKPNGNNLGGLGNTISNYYQNTGDRNNRIYMGGGGGTSTQNPDSIRFSTNGGNGGGIIILITDTIQANGFDTIRARGESVTNMASAGAGGGGGGGVIVLEAVGCKGNLAFDVRGGNGGTTNHPDATGPGGSGGGGVIWHRGNSLPCGTVQINAGDVGKHLPSLGLRSATSGTVGKVFNGLRIPLSGFLFNVMPEDQDICEGDTPAKFIASTPKGGNGPGTYRYRWIQSFDKINWIDAPESDTLIKDYQAGALFDTIYFKRIVRSGVTIDTSLILTINVLPRLENNDIAADDTICYGAVIPDIKDDPVYNIIGGDGKYKFSWLSSTDAVNWGIMTGRDSLILHNEQPIQTTYYRRIVNSHVCWDTSNSVTMTVLPVISDNDIFSGNMIYPDDTICQNDDALPLTGVLPGGGDGVYKYIWQSGPDTLSWNPTIPSNGQNFDPGVLSDTIWYRRIVLSGSDDVCKDTSNTVNILVHPLITNNLIARDTVICMDDRNLQLTQLSGNVGGGNKMLYKYYWQSKVESGAWEETGNEVTQRNYSPGYIEDTTLFRRLVISGACEDFSNEIEVIVQDSVMHNQIYSGNLIYPNDTICRYAVPVPLTGTSPANGEHKLTGGDIKFSTPSYQWELSLNGTLWTTVTGATMVDYPPPALSDTTYYRRKVSSGKCIHFSDPVEIIVQSPITNNTVKNGQEDETCYETTLDLDGTAGIFEMTGGDRMIYVYGWQKSPDDQTWSPAPGINWLADYTTEELIQPVYFRRFVTSGACSDTTGPTFVSINPRPTAEIIIAQYLTECYDANAGPVEVSIPYLLTGATPFRIISYDGFDYDTIENINTTEGTFIDYLTTGNTNDFNIEIIELMDGNGCFAYPDSLTGMVAMTVYKQPEINITGGIDPMEVCDDLIQLVATQDVGTGLWVKAEGDETLSIDDPEQLSIQLSIQHGTGNSKYYKLYRTGKNWPVAEEEKCISRDSVEVIFWKEPEPAYAGSRTGVEFDTIIYFADYIYMYANPPTAGSGQWTISSGSANIDNDSLYNTKINLGDQNLDEQADYTFRWTVNNGTCPETSDELTVSRRDLRIYDGFSPDGNSINEFFTIEGLEFADTWDLKLFSRSGNLIRKISKGMGETQPEEDMLWDGTYDGGRPVESGIYYYILEVTKGNSPYQYKGFVVIARERQ